MKNYDNLSKEERYKMILEESFESCALKEEEENRKRILDEYHENLIKSLSFSEREIFDRQVKEEIEVLQDEITKEKLKIKALEERYEKLKHLLSIKAKDERENVSKKF